MSEPIFDEPESSSSSSSHEGLPKSTVILALLCVVFVGGTTFLAMRWTGAQKNTAELEAQMVILGEQEADLLEQVTPLRAQFAELEGRTGVLFNGKFEICNESNKDVRLYHLMATYLDDEGEFQTFDSDDFGSQLWTIRPGERKDLGFLQGDVSWDGSVLYYMAILRGNDGLNYPFAGVWPPNSSNCLLWSKNF